MPGMVGLHNHLYYYQSAPRVAQMQYSGPRLYLGAGVTTVRTTGSMSPYQDISLKHSVERGEVPGPRIVITAPYVISPGPDERLRDLGMYVIRDEDSARRYVRYWAAEGAEWVKVYTQISRAALSAVIDEAHRQGIKVMGHLCSVSFREATALGIDNLEAQPLGQLGLRCDARARQVQSEPRFFAGRARRQQPRRGRHDRRDRRGGRGHHLDAGRRGAGDSGRPRSHGERTSRRSPITWFRPKWSADR